jgi:FHA domain
MFKLILRFQDTVLEEYSFDKTPVSMGRRDSNDVVIDNMAVSGTHASIETEPPNAYVLVDNDSLNGTFLNETKITRQKVFDGDLIIVGKHILEFRDLRPIEDRPPREDGDVVPRAAEIRETVMLDTEAQQELLAKQSAEKGSVAGESVEKPPKVELFGSLTIVAGGTPEIIDLTMRLTVLGKSDQADVKCAGLLVGKKAAQIEKRPSGFFLAYAEGIKKPELNGATVSTRVQLHDGDELVIGSTRMTFNQREEISNQ